MTANTYPHDALPKGFPLLWYEVEAILGRGGFGITYLAKDQNLQKMVALKEFMPSEFVKRDERDQTIKPANDDKKEIFEWGLNRFRDEARTLAQFKHANIVRVLTVFDQNNTAYMAMEYEKGEEFGKLLKQGIKYDETGLQQIILPILDGLRLVHEGGYIHRDIKPSNIFIREDGSPVLIDFGSARQTLGSKTHTLTSLVSIGYAPFEQYNVDGDKQGPWTDIYSLAATLYYATIGKKPVDAMKRGTAIMNGLPDPYEPAEWVGDRSRFSENFLKCIDAGMNFRTLDRPQDTAIWSEMLLGNEPPLPLAFEVAPIDEGETRVMKPGKDRSQPFTADRSRHKFTKEGITHSDPTIINQQTNQSSKRRPIIAFTIFAIAALAVVTYIAFEPNLTFKPNLDSKPKEQSNIAPPATIATIPEPPPPVKEIEQPEIEKPEPVIPKKVELTEEEKQLIALQDQVKQLPDLKSKEFDLQAATTLLNQLLDIEPDNQIAKKRLSEIHQDLNKKADQSIANYQFQKAEILITTMKEAQAPRELINALNLKIEKAKITLEQKRITELNEKLRKEREELLAEKERAKKEQEERAKKAKEKAASSSTKQEEATPKPATKTTYPAITEPDIQGAMLAVERIKTGIEERNLAKIQSISVIPKKQLELLKDLLNNHQYLETQVSQFEHLKQQHKAIISITIIRMINLNGRKVEFASNKPKFSFTAEYTPNGDWKAFW